MPTDGYNWFLIIVAIVCSVLVTIINVYILVHFQHPEDRNQAWFPKIVVVRVWYPRSETRTNVWSDELSPFSLTRSVEFEKKSRVSLESPASLARILTRSLLVTASPHEISESSGPRLDVIRALDIVTPAGRREPRGV